jgi:hypothetical protein
MILDFLFVSSMPMYNFVSYYTSGHQKGLDEEDEKYLYGSCITTVARVASSLYCDYDTSATY